MSGTEPMIALACMIVDGVDTRVSTHILRTQLGPHYDKPHLELRQQLEKVSCIFVLHSGDAFERSGCAIFLLLLNFSAPSFLPLYWHQTEFNIALYETIRNNYRWNLEADSKC